MSIKQYLRQAPIVQAYLKRKRVAEWIGNGYPVPVPHAIKQMTIEHYAIVHKLENLVETGTYLGDTIWAQKDHFKKIYSIELSEMLYEKAKKRFKRFPQIRLIQGDSSEQIGNVLKEIKTPALFWLDGHYSGGITAKGDKVCPIYAELGHIFRSPLQHLVLIDDARLFTGEDDYPTLEALRQFIRANSTYQVAVENDIIVLTP